MAAQTFTGARGASGHPVYAGTYGNIRVAYGNCAVTENPEDGDIWQLCRLPAGAVVVGGYFAATDIDSGTETLDIDLGWAANGAENANPTGFGNFGVLTGDTVTDVTNGVVANIRHLGFVNFPTFTRETIVQAEANAAANAGGTGTLSCVIYYVVP